MVSLLRRIFHKWTDSFSTAIAQANNRNTDLEFYTLLQSLQTISTKWRGDPDIEDSHTECVDDPNVDLAQIYAAFLTKLHEKCRESRDFRFNLLDHSCSSLGHSPHTPLNNMANAIYALNPSSDPDSARDLQVRETSIHSRPNKRKRLSSLESSNNFHPNGREIIASKVRQHDDPFGHGHSDPRTQQHSATPSTASGQPYQISSIAAVTDRLGNTHELSCPPTIEYAQGSENQDVSSVPDFQTHYNYNDVHSLSNTLMDSQYMELDRVITFENANFHTMSFDGMWHA